MSPNKKTREALEEIRNTLDDTAEQKELRHVVDEALTSNDTEKINQAIRKFDMLETTIIQRLRKPE